MKILVTGAFGTVGLVTLREGLSRGHEVTAFVRPSRRNKRIARRLRRDLRDSGSELLRVHWGDIRSRTDVVEALMDQDAVIHLAAMLPPRCDAYPGLCEAVNVGGTTNLLDALGDRAGGASRAGRSSGVLTDAPALVYVSSVSVMGVTQSKMPPVTVEDPVRPSDTYSASKVAAEAVVRASLVPWSILRLSAVMPTSGFYRVSMVRLMFDMALAARCEVVLDIDAAYALVQAAESLCDGGAIRGKTVFVAGGADQGCQMNVEQMLDQNLAPIGLSLPRRQLFCTDVDSYYLDWYDTAEGQEILGYQRHSADDWQRLSFRRFRILRWVLRPVRRVAALVMGLMAPKGVD